MLRQRSSDPNRSQATTAAPSAASECTMFEPMKPAAPVTSTSLPLRLSVIACLRWKHAVVMAKQGIAPFGDRGRERRSAAEGAYAHAFDFGRRHGGDFAKHLRESLSVAGVADEAEAG